MLVITQTQKSKHIMYAYAVKRILLQLWAWVLEPQRLFSDAMGNCNKVQNSVVFIVSKFKINRHIRSRVFGIVQTPEVILTPHLIDCSIHETSANDLDLRVRSVFASYV